MKKRKVKTEHEKEVEKYWNSLSLERKVQALRDQGHTFPHSITFKDKQVAFLKG